MMSRLEEIKNSDFDLLSNIERFNKDYLWLIEQAEKVEDLERKLKDLSELIETESYTDHRKCQDVVCITPLIDVIKSE